MRKQLAPIKNPKNDPTNYDLVILGTPVWAGSIPSPTRAYVSKTKDNLKKMALFSTHADVHAKPVLTEIEEICGKKAIAILDLQQRKVKQDIIVTS
ncbi:MAG: flavodoxin family protein [Candidatus Hodarchaeota archaeon]